jgi:predicted dehydrogenase
VLIVGCGRIAGGFNESDESAVLTHAVAYRRLNADIVGCVDLDGEAASRFARRWSIPRAGNDLAALVHETQPEVVSLCTPPGVRLGPLRLVLAVPSVRSVLVEKPLALTVEEAQQIRALAAATGRAVLVNYFRAFDPFYVEVERACRAGELGQFCLGTAFYYGDAVTNASHLVERLLAMFGPPSSARRLGGDARQPTFELAWEGARVVFLAAIGCHYSPIEMDLFFESGRLRIVDSEGRAERFAARPDRRYPDFLNLAPVPLASPSAPSPDSMFGPVRAALAAAEEARPAGESGTHLTRAVDVVRVLHEIEVGRG